MRHYLDAPTRRAILEGMKIVIDSKLIERLRVGPLSPYLDAYLTRVEQEGFLPSSVPRQIYAIARFSRWLERMDYSLQDLDESGVRDFLGRDPGVVHYPERSTIRRLFIVLRELGVLRAKQPAKLTAVQRHVAEYRRYLIKERGLAQSCLRNYTSYVEKFLSGRFAERDPCLESLCSADVTSFIALQVSQLSPGRAKLVVTALRSYLRFLLYRGDITVPLAGCIPSVARWSLATTPKSLPAGTVQRVLEQQNRTTPLGLRNYAILLLLARLGLRAGEVVQLNIEDIDWENGVIKIRRKGGRWTPLPLLNDVGEALANYLRSGRPQSCCRRVFLRHRAPVNGLSHTITVSSIVRRLLIRTGVDSPRTGAHLLRHSLAVDLLRKGASLEEIGDVLGHRSQNTTAIYAKVDLAALRHLALAWPGGAQ